MGAYRHKLFHLCVSTACGGSLGEYLRWDTWLLQGKLDEVNSIPADNYSSVKPFCSLNTDQGDFPTFFKKYINIFPLSTASAWAGGYAGEV